MKSRIIQLLFILVLLTGCRDRDVELTVAAYFGGVDKVKHILKEGGQINVSYDSPYIHDMSPLRAAAYSGHVEIVKLLVSKGAKEKQIKGLLTRGLEINKGQQIRSQFSI